MTADPTELSVDAAALRRAIGNVLPFTGDDDTLPVLTSVLLEADNQVLTATATDRYAVGRNTVTCGHGSLPATLLRRRDAKALRRHLKGIKGVVTVTRSDGAVTATAHQDYSLTVPVLDATFPDLDALFDSWHDERSTDGVGLSPRLLARFAKVQVDWDSPMRLWLYGAKKALHIRIGDEFAGMLMPVNVGDDNALAVPPRPRAKVAS